MARSYLRPGLHMPHRIPINIRRGRSTTLSAPQDVRIYLKYRRSLQSLSSFCCNTSWTSLKAHICSADRTAPHQPRGITTSPKLHRVSILLRESSPSCTSWLLVDPAGTRFTGNMEYFRGTIACLGVPTERRRPAGFWADHERPGHDLLDAAGGATGEEKGARGSQAFRGLD